MIIISSLAEALRKTAARLETAVPYRWTHMGACNCGHLVQTISRRSPAEIHRMALEKAGDWRDQAVDYCATSGYPMDHILAELHSVGMRTRDIEHLERLSDPRVLRRIRVVGRALDYRSREDAVIYMRAWADLLDEEAAAMHEQEMPADFIREAV